MISQQQKQERSKFPTSLLSEIEGNMKCTFLLGNLKTVNFGYFEFSVNHDSIPQSFNVDKTKTFSKMGLRVMSHSE